MLNPRTATIIQSRARLRAALARLWGTRNLIWQMVKREVVGRYRGSLLGVLWSFLNPIFMLAVYTFVFGVVFRARWGGGEIANKADFAIVLFAGLIIYNFFAEMVNRAPGLVVGNANYVKKVVFPLEILPLVTAGSALFHTVVSIGVLLLFQLLSGHGLSATAWLFPVVLAPLVVLCIGLAWILASLGVFLRDIAQVIGLLVTAMFFLSPIVYPASALPESARMLLLANPLVFIIEQGRAVLIWGQWPNWAGLLLYALVSGVVALAGYAWFQKTRSAFADVL